MGFSCRACYVVGSFASHVPLNFLDPYECRSLYSSIIRFKAITRSACNTLPRIVGIPKSLSFGEFGLEINTLFTKPTL